MSMILFEGGKYYPQQNGKKFLAGMMIHCLDGYCGLYDGHPEGFHYIKFDTEDEARQFLIEQEKK